MATSAAADYPGDVLAACCGPALHLWRPGNASTNADQAGADQIVPFDSLCLAAAWNRNNKVVAAARDDGTIELRYSNGALMTALPKGGAPPGARPLTSLAWSMGSKRLAAGSRDGTVYVHDMTAKTCTPVTLGSAAASPVSAVAFHPDDRFMAAAGRRLALFSVQTLAPAGTLDIAAAGALGSGFTSLGVAAGQSMIAAGTAAGAVAVWDYKTRQQLHVDAGRHAGGAAAAVQFAPLDPSVLYSAGADGALLMQDLRAGPFHVPTARVGAGAPLASLAIREDFAWVAAGAADGRVLLWDPRYSAAPAATLRCGDPAPVTSLHWQHNYQSLTTRARAAAAAAVAEGALPAGRLSLALSGIGEEGSSWSGEAGGSGTPGGAPAAAAGPPAPLQGRLSLASSLASHLEPPRKLDMSPMVTGRASLAPAAVPAAAARPQLPRLPELSPLDRFRRESAAGSTAAAPAAAAPVAPAVVSPSPSAVSLDATGPPKLQQESQEREEKALSPPPPAAPVMREESTAAAPTLPAATPSQPIEASPSAGPPSWRIRALSPRAGDAATAAVEQPFAFDHRTQTPGPVVQPRGSPAKVPLTAAAKTAPPAPPSAPVAAVLPGTDAAALQQDILALHLDMLNQFKEQQEASAAAMAAMAARQDALAAEVSELRRELRELLSRRDGMLWL